MLQKGVVSVQGVSVGSALQKRGESHILVLGLNKFRTFQEKKQNTKTKIVWMIVIEKKKSENKLCKN